MQEDSIVSIYACDPVELSRFDKNQSIDAAQIDKLVNHLQVSVDNYSAIFDLNAKEPRLVQELDSTDKL